VGIEGFDESTQTTLDLLFVLQRLDILDNFKVVGSDEFYSIRVEVKGGRYA
jgi:hypothetical protein